ncbi:50S ribosomal protein L15 [Geodia barretti]|jgi:large subunit ribosomal protein L15|uniref:Large ribosomal subunit protein uL15m n=1 Tax=Geodia barretti TaxID=519541 RepID=A0AA35W0A2_GEOBA|nr:50S ribosomal protein L15 [Geodia barretti]
MQQQDLRSPRGAKKARRRVGRGDSSGYGSFSGRGVKGQNSRSGGGVRPYFEGGQLPLSQKLPFIRGFTNIFRVEYNVVNVEKLAQFAANSEISPEVLRNTGILRTLNKPVKILGRGEIDIPLNVTAHKFSASARQKIEAAGGSVRETG